MTSSTDQQIEKAVEELYISIFYSGKIPSYKTNCRGFRAHTKQKIEDFLKKMFAKMQSKP